MKYYLIAGEASGDLHGSNLMKELKAQDTSAEFRFIGGEQMQAVGGTLVTHYKTMAYMGIVPVILHLGTILKNMAMCKQDIADWKPDVVILIDYPGFNLKIAEYVHKQRICPVFYYISPKIWAWKEHRIKNIRRDVDELFSILPFEVKWFADRQFPIHYVGNPCVDAIERDRLNGGIGDIGVNGHDEKAIIAILAGSRRQEIKDNLRKMLTAASRFKDYRLVIAGAPNIELDYYKRYMPEGVDAEVKFGQTYLILRGATAALVTSGTATLETAILRVPQVVCYYMAPPKLVTFVRKLILHVPFISLVNLVAGREIVTELVADGMTVENVERHLAEILPGGTRREQMLSDYEEMNRILGGPGASERAAKEMINALKKYKDGI
ncbi:MAG: lipid-A-disaccharide synthase [Bacteroidaceae bacterium]|nr:lipid-A-disaccharide synthase [Bacteroidaceae bacterium]